MNAPRVAFRSPVLFVLPVLAVLATAGCNQAVGDPGTTAARQRDARDTVGARYPADVYRPADYVLYSVDEDAGALVLRGTSADATAALFAQARAAMPMQGWSETRAEAPRLLAFEKAGYRAELTFAPGAGATELALRFERP
jgi:hypothetical protein